MMLADLVIILLSFICIVSKKNISLFFQMPSLDSRTLFLLCLLWFDFSGVTHTSILPQMILFGEKKAEQCCYFKNTRVSLNGSLMQSGNFDL